MANWNVRYNILGPNYEFDDVRLATFRNWSCSWIDPEILALAGFYYTDERDEVHCFKCNMTISEWQKDDNLMTELQEMLSKRSIHDIVRRYDIKEWSATTRDDFWIQHAKGFICPYLARIRGPLGYVSRFFRRSCLKVSLSSRDNKVDKKMEKFALIKDVDNGSSSSGNSQNLLKSEEMNIKEVNAVSGEASSKEQSDQDDKVKLCKICFSRELRIIFMPCGYAVACALCARKMKICIVCFTPVVETLQALTTLQRYIV